MNAKRISLSEVKLKGVGDVYAKKIANAGIKYVNDIAIMTPHELVGYSGLGIETAKSVIEQCREVLGPMFISAEDLLERQGEIPKLTTGSTELDRILGGGLHYGAIHEFIGAFGSGKSQIMLTSNVYTANQGKKVLVIDTEGTYKPERLEEIARSNGFDVEQVLSNTIISRAYNSEHLLYIIEKLPMAVGEYDIQLVIVDSIISHFRAEYKGLGSLADRQKDLGYVIHMLTRVAGGYKIPVAVTNQVQTKVGTLIGDPNQPAGGNIMAHGGTYRVFLRKGKEDKGNRSVLAQVIDSSHLPPEKIRLWLTVGGVKNDE